MEEEEEAVRKHCVRLISLVQQKQLEFSEGGRVRRRRRTGPEGAAVAGDESPQHGPSHLSLPPPGPLRPVPLQLISTLRLKTVEEEMRRAAEVELHDPAACSACEQEQASVALRSFIRRKKTQLQLQTLKGRLNTHRACGERTRCGGSSCKISQSPPMPLSGFGRHYSVDTCGSQQPGVASATAEERGVALATDEMRGYPDKNATGTHLASSRCPFCRQIAADMTGVVLIQ